MGRWLNLHQSHRVCYIKLPDAIVALIQYVFPLLKGTYMLNTYLKFFLLTISLSSLLGCASVPTHIKIQPDITLDKGPNTFSNPRPWRVASQDLRVARHLIEIVDGDNVAQLINEEESLRRLIENSLTQAWVNNGLKLDEISGYHIDINLIKSLATVTESSFSYSVKSQLMIKVQLFKQENTYVKLFRSNEQWEAPFSANVPAINEKLNTQLSQLLKQIIQDEELNAKLEKF